MAIGVQEARGAAAVAGTAERHARPRLGRRFGNAVRSRTGLSVGLVGLLVLFWVLGFANGTSAGGLLSLTIWGIMLGGILALGSIGLTLAYGVLKFPNFAHGALVTVGAYAAFALMPLFPETHPLKPFSFGWELIIGLVLAVPVVAIVALLCDLVLYRRLRRRNASLLILTMASLAAAFFLRAVIYLIWGSDFHFYYLGRANPVLPLPYDIRVQADQLFVLGLAFFLVLLVYVLLERTKMGKAMRATANNPELAQVRGINTERIIGLTWILGGGLAAAGGVMYGLASQLRPEMGFDLLLPMFAAAILGSIGSPIGALVGAIIIGIAEQLSASFLNPAYGPGVAFMVMVVVLIVRPEGLFVQAGD
ncbi:MAG: branched-chain amino acid ABC transporter permease [Acetobacteraceae bacterium]